MSILQLHWKKRLQYRYFLMNFARYIRYLFYRTSSGDCFCSTEKYFTTKLVKSTLEKEQSLGAACKKNKIHAEKKLKHCLHQVFIFFYYSKISLLLFSLLPRKHWKHEFIETMQSHWGFIYYRKLFLTFSNLTLTPVSFKNFLQEPLWT